MVWQENAGVARVKSTNWLALNITVLEGQLFLSYLFYFLFVSFLCAEGGCYGLIQFLDKPFFPWGYEVSEDNQGESKVVLFHYHRF